MKNQRMGVGYGLGDGLQSFHACSECVYLPLILSLINIWESLRTS